MNGSYSKFIGEHLHYENIEFIEAKNVFTIKIGKFERKIVVISNEPENTREQIELLRKHNAYVFYFSENSVKETLRTISVNPLDPDSTERAGIFIKRFLLSLYTEKLKQKFKYPQLLRDYVKYIPQIQIRFDTSDYTYTFHSYPNPI